MKGNSMSYTVVEEFIVLRDAGAVHYSEIGSAVELSDDEAGPLLAAGKIEPQSQGDAEGLAELERRRAEEARRVAEEEEQAEALRVAEEEEAERARAEAEAQNARRET